MSVAPWAEVNNGQVQKKIVEEVGVRKWLYDAHMSYPILMLLLDSSLRRCLGYRSAGAAQSLFIPS